MRLSFHGAAGDVTGSCHLLEACGKRILIDCGLFQGSRQLAEENADAFGFEAAGLDLMLLTHAHLDHCGRVPLLSKRGYRGRILTTAATVELAKLVMLDSARLQSEDRQHHPVPDPLYDENDVAQAAGQMDGRMVYGKPVELFPGLRATFHDAGHILGSAWILLEITEGATVRRLVFSGDLGNRDKPLLNPLEALTAAGGPLDAVVMESTYGDRNHRSQAESEADFRQAVAATLARGGNVVIPAFALERAQDLLYLLRGMEADGVLPAATPVFLDSPMAISATEIFRRHPEDFNATTAALLAAGHDPFAMPGLRFTQDGKASMAIQNARGAVILAGSGMCTGGRILHHLQHNLGDARNAVVFVGYAAAGTLARKIMDGAREVKVYGQAVTVRAQVHSISGFSAHAGHDDLLAWAESGRPKQVILVHGERAAAEFLAKDLRAAGFPTTIPSLGQTLDLDAGEAARA